MSTERSRSSRSATKVTAHDDELMTTLASIQADTKATSENLEALNVKFDTFVENSKIDTLSNDVSSLKKTVSMLCARLERSDTIVARLSRELTEMKTHSMKYNLISALIRRMQTATKLKVRTVLPLLNTSSLLS